jgi:excinuclease ABC subunit B
MYADKVTDSMARMIRETNRRREKQLDYNARHNITPAQIVKSTRDILGQTAVADSRMKAQRSYVESESYDAAADPLIRYLAKEKLQKLVLKTRKSMETAVKELDFLEAARLRDELLALEKLLKSKEE